MSEISNLIGREADLPRVSRAIRLFAEEMDASTVGGYHITCSDDISSPAAIFGLMRFEPLYASSYGGMILAYTRLQQCQRGQGCIVGIAVKLTPRQT